MSIQEKLYSFAIRPLMVFVGLVIVMMGLFYWASHGAMVRETENKAKSMKQMCDQARDRSKAYAQLIASSIDVQRGAAEDQRHFAMRIITPLLKNLKLDLITVHEKDGYVLAKAHDPDHFGAEQRNIPSISDALAGKTTSGIRKVENGLAIATTVPIALDEANVGAVTAGYFLNDHFAKEMSQALGADILVLSFDSVIGSSMKNLPTKSFRGKKLAKNRASMWAGIKLYDAKYLPLTPDGTIGVYIVVDNSGIRRAFLALFIISAVGAAIIFILMRTRAKKFAENFTEPIIRTAAMADRVAHGDLNVEPLKTESRDEMGRLTDSFNVMTRNLQQTVERDRALREYLEEQVRRLLVVMEAASSGDFSRTFHAEHDDEIGRLGLALNKMIHNLQEMIESDRSQREYLETQVTRLVEVIEAASTGDFSHTFEETRDDAFARVGRALNRMVVDIQSIMNRDQQRRRYLEEQVNRLLEVIEAASHGDFSRTFQVTRDDQVGRLGKALNGMTGELKKTMEDIDRMKEDERASKELLEKQVEDILQVVRRAAAGDLTVSLSVQETDAIGQLKDNLNRMFASLRDMVGRLRENAGLVERTCLDVQRIAKTLRDGAGSQVDSVGRANAIVDRMVQSIATIAGNAERMLSISGDASREADTGGKTVSKTLDGMGHIRSAMEDIDESMKELSAGAEKIEEIVRAIDEISDETNLLALNASIEAARAGDLGKGFAVVAREVGNLAQMSVDSTRNITEVVRSIQERIRNAGKTTVVGSERVAEGLGLAGESGDALQRIVASVSKVTEIIRDTAVSLEQQRRESRDILDAMKSVGSVSEVSVRSAQEVTEAVTGLGEMADELNRMVGQFKVDG